MLDTGRLLPYLPALYQAGKVCQGQILKLITSICKLRHVKSLITLVPGANVIKPDFSITGHYGKNKLSCFVRGKHFHPLFVSVARSLP